ncbi:MAG: transcription termination/antitermination NusG family protein [Verrucomicrobiales bacterium]|nr:transcription termination/antitermination NusG family protein [Verrucomicrobiales bacterium]
MPTILEEGESGWFVVRTRPKSEHIAAAHLIQFANLEEVFSPRVKFEKGTRRGKVWFVEALFPGYIFARFDLAEKLRAVNATNAVSGVLRFADLYPQVSDHFIQQLRDEFPESENEVRIIDRPIQEGDEVLILDGVMAGIETVVTRIMSGKERVRVLMNWLGEEREAEVCYSSISPTRPARTDL